MKDLTIKELLQKTNPKINAAIKKLVVRELDEEGKGNYVAFVDDGDDTCDVNIKLHGDKIEGVSCDCDKPMPCLHVFAVAKAVGAPAEKKKTVKRTAKESPIVQLLRSVDESALREWIKTLLEKNKDLQVSFTHHFSPKKNFTSEELDMHTRQAVKSIVKNKKNIDPTILKKIFELWNDIHKPVIELYQSNAGSAAYFELIKVIVNNSLYYKDYFHITTVKFDKYIDDVLRVCSNAINGLENDATWKKAIDLVAESLVYDNKVFRPHYASQLYSIIEISDQEKQDYIFGKFEEFAIKYQAERNYMWYFNFTQNLFDVTVKQGVFEKYNSLFYVAYGQNEYNLNLIRELMKLGMFAQAEKFCNECAKGNYNESYSVPYWLLLKEIYIATGKKKALAEVGYSLLPFTYDFEDYLRVIENIANDEERKKFRTKIFSSARKSGSYSSNKAIEFCFRLLDYEKKYLKMIELIQSFSNYKMLLQYFEPMFAADKLRLLKALVEKNDHSYYYSEDSMRARGKDEEAVKILLDLMIQKYDQNILNAAFRAKINDRWSYSKNKLVERYQKK